MTQTKSELFSQLNLEVVSKKLYREAFKRDDVPTSQAKRLADMLTQTARLEHALGILLQIMADKTTPETYAEFIKTYNEILDEKEAMLTVLLLTHHQSFID